jgi:hypothetical protein
MSDASDKRRRWIVAVALAAAMGAGAAFWIRSERGTEKQAKILHLSDVEGKAVRFPSLPSVQMHLIPRTQPTPLSPAPPSNGTDRR